MTDHNFFVFKFADIEVSESEHALTRGGEVVTVEPTAFRVLIYLLRNPGRLVTKDEIIAAVWRDTAVSDNSLTRSIATLRRLLGDRPEEPRYIATVQRLGYRFLVPVEPAEKSTRAAAEAVTPGQNATENPQQPAAQHGPAVRRSVPRWLIPASAGLLLALVLAGFLLTINRRTHSQARSDYPTFVRAAKAVVTVPGVVTFPALSPDGKQIAFTWRSQTKPRDDLYVQLIGADQPLQITHNTSGFICCAAWSADGQQIAYGHCDDNGGAVFVVPPMGGVERKITEVVCPFNDAGSPQWTADGQSLLLSDQCSSNGPRGIVLFSLLLGEKRCLTSPPPGGENFGDFAPTLSPDQKTVAFGRATTLNRNDVYIVDLSGKNLRQLTHNGYISCAPLMWTADGKYVVFTSSEPNLLGPSRVSVKGGPIEPASMFPAVGSLSRDGRRLAYVDGSGSQSTWHVELASAGGKVLALKNISISSVFEDSTGYRWQESSHQIRARGRKCRDLEN